MQTENQIKLAAVEIAELWWANPSCQGKTDAVEAIIRKHLTENQMLAARLLRAFPWLEEDFADVGGGDTVQELQDLYEDMLSGDAPVSPEPEQSPTATATGQEVSGKTRFLVRVSGNQPVWADVLVEAETADEALEEISGEQVEQADWQPCEGGNGVDDWTTTGEVFDENGEEIEEAEPDAI